MAASVVHDETSGPMKRSKFSEEQIVYALGYLLRLGAVGDLGQQLSVNDATFYALKKK